MDELKKLTLAATAAIVLCPPAYAHKDCMRVIVSSRDGWAQVRGQPGLSGKPLWRITNGMSLTWCGDELPDIHGHPWKWITFQSEQEPWGHNGWVAAGLLGQSSPLPAPEPVPTAAPAAPVVPAPAAAPMEQHTTNNFIIQGGEPPFDASACVTTLTISEPLEVYKKPDETSETIAALQVNDKICVLSFGDWSHVHWRRGESFDGWVHHMGAQTEAKPY
jgi:hypothetical protein